MSGGGAAIRVVRGSVAPAPESIEVFVDVGDAVFPDFVFPRFGGKSVLEDPAIALQGGHLAGFFLERRSEMRDSVSSAGFS
jgi:hypothetical protein